MSKNIKQIKVKKLLILLLLPILLLTFSNLKTNASYVILDNVPFNFFYDVEMVYADQPSGTISPNPYILISWNKYLNEDHNPVYIRAYDTVEGYYDSGYDYTTTYRSPDYVQLSQTYVKNQFIDWFGVENGTRYSSYFTIVKVVGGTNIPAMGDLTFVIFANRGGYTAIDYTSSTIASTDPTKEFDRYIALELAGYNQGYSDSDSDINVIRNQIRAEELIKYANDRNEYENYIDRLQEELLYIESLAYDDGYEEGLAEGATLNDEDIYNEAYKEGLKVGSNNKFYDNIEKWLVPAIIVVLFFGGVLLVFQRRRD